MASHYSGAKVSAESVADHFVRAMLGRKNEVAIGVSQLARVLARLGPHTGFKILNDLETKAAAEKRD